jgi:hypothetical protein
MHFTVLQLSRFKASDISHQSFRLFASKHQMFRIKASGCSHQSIRCFASKHQICHAKLHVRRFKASNLPHQRFNFLASNASSAHVSLFDSLKFRPNIGKCMIYPSFLYISRNETRPAARGRCGRFALFRAYRLPISVEGEYAHEQTNGAIGDQTDRAAS